MTAMLIATLLAGVAATRILAAAGLQIFAIRYAVAVVVAYAVFVGSVRLWLLYIAFCAAAAKRRQTSNSGDDWFDCLNFSGSGSSSLSGGSSSSLTEGGGRFGGGGASGSWGAPQSASRSVMPAFFSSSSTKSSSSSKGDGDFGELMLVVLIIAVVVAVIAVFFWMIYAAPAILSEAAFNAVLAGALAKHAQRATRGSWVGSVIHATWMPFALILVLAVVLGWFAQKYCPAATRLSEAVHCAHPAM